jgi:hypothetical protein
VDESFGLQDIGQAEICEELEVRKQAAEAALRRLDELSAESDLPPETVNLLRQPYRQRIEKLTEYQERIGRDGAETPPAVRRVILELLQTERSELERLAEHDEVSPSVADRTRRDLEAQEVEVSR